jgi:flagellar biosynthesis/type III secretory pathway protein FliH
MAIKHYLVELATEVPITINDNNLRDNSIYETVLEATQHYINDYIETDEQFLVKIVAEQTHKESDTDV